MPFTISSPAIPPDGAIPAIYTCEGQDLAPPLEWRDPPAGTKSFALVLDDPDAPDPAAPKMTWVHWVLYDLPPGVTSLPEGGKAPASAHQGLNDWKRIGYNGPCPPIGRHRYFFKLYALDTMLGDLKKPTKAGLEKAIGSHALGKAELVATYQKARK